MFKIVLTDHILTPLFCFRKRPTPVRSPPTLAMPASNNTLLTHLHIIHHITSTSASNTASTTLTTHPDQQFNNNLFFSNFYNQHKYHLIL